MLEFRKDCKGTLLACIEAIPSPLQGPTGAYIECR